MAKKVPGLDFSFRNDKSPLCCELLREQAAVCSLFNFVLALVQQPLKYALLLPYIVLVEQAYVYI
jgi:hypothetical protein